jgi:hypothetical protein
MAGCEMPGPSREESPVVMYGRKGGGGRWTHPPRDRPERTRQSGGGRKFIPVRRKPCLAYAVARKPDGSSYSRPEPGGVVLRRMWEMYDQDYVKMCALRQRYHWGKGDQHKWRKWTADYYMGMKRKKSQSRLRRQMDETWNNYMATVGKKLGLQEPIIYEGPTVSITEEEDQQSEPSYAEKNKPAPMGIYEKHQMRRKLKHEHPVWNEMKAGQWPEDVGQPDWIFRLFKRPLKRDVYDVPQYPFTSDKIKARGQVL